MGRSLFRGVSPSESLYVSRTSWICNGANKTGRFWMTLFSPDGDEPVRAIRSHWPPSRFHQGWGFF